MMFYSKAAQNIMTVTGRARDFMLEPTKKMQHKTCTILIQ